VTSTYENYDVVIAGAGPAGSSAAIRLALAGLEVLLVEQKKFPRQKLCGEFITPECIEHLNELGVLEEISMNGAAEISKTAFYSQSGRSFAVPSAMFGDGDGSALGLSRSMLDEILVQKAIAAGVTVWMETKAAGFLSAGDGKVQLVLRQSLGGETRVDARLALDATGRTRGLSRLAEPRHTAQQRPKYVAFKAHFRGVEIAEQTCEIYAYRGGYGGCNRVEQGIFNVCFIARSDDVRRFGSDPEATMRGIICRNKRAAVALRNARPVGAWSAVSIERFGRAALAPAPGILTVGDAAAFIDPFTGSGILIALESAKLVAEAIQREISGVFDFQIIAQDYYRSYSAAFDARLRLCSVLRTISFVPFLAGTVIAILAHSTGSIRRLARLTRFRGELPNTYTGMVDGIKNRP